MQRKRRRRPTLLNRRKRYPKKRKKRVKKQRGRGFFSPLGNMFKSAFKSWEDYSARNNLLNVHVP